jgi:gamma-glutamyl-gamma-aminobutyrate hydrolase PuuD
MPIDIRGLKALERDREWDLGEEMWQPKIRGLNEPHKVRLPIGKAIFNGELVENDPNKPLKINLGLAKPPQNPKPKIFWGGSDLDPSFYGKERSIRCGQSFIKEDQNLLEDMADCIKAGMPVIGICRSSQVLNVLNGGILVQHIDNHTRKHEVSLYNKDKHIVYTCGDVSSTHHQMMVAHKDGIILAKHNEPTTGVHWDNVNEPYEYKYVTEVVYYPKTKSLCIQPHPEWMPQDHFFIQWLNQFIFDEWGSDPINFQNEEHNRLRTFI